MNQQLCKWHKLPFIRKNVCPTCEKDLQKMSDQLNIFFSSPKVTKIINKNLSLIK